MSSNSADVKEIILEALGLEDADLANSHFTIPMTAMMAAILAVEGIGRKTLAKIAQCLFKEDATWSDFWDDKSSEIWAKCRLNKRQTKGLKNFQKRFTPETYIGWVRDKEIEVVGLGDKLYPELLKHIDDPPFVLYTKGCLKRVNLLPIAIVGTRRCSGYGRSNCQRLVAELVACQVTIVSGFMYGIDVIAQRQAVADGGYTVGVLGYGFDHLYPSSQRYFFKEMLAKGNAFISEYPPWVRGHKGNFPERNRIVAGMSLVTVVIEAALKSGSHITARFAGENGRGVCAVPGPITNFYSEGTKYLINDGAKLVSSARDILGEVGYSDQAFVKALVQPDFLQVRENKKATVATQITATPLQQQIYQCLRNNPVSSEELAKQLKIPISTVNATITLLELEGYLQQQHQVWYPKNLDGVQ